MTNTSKSYEMKLKREKRIKKIKKIVVFTAIFLLLSSVILNFILLIKVFQLQEQVNRIFSVSESVNELQI